MSESLSQQVLAELRTQYLRSLWGKLLEFSEALHARDFKMLERLGHQMKGSGRSYGYAEITDFGRQVEDAAEGRRVIALQWLLIEFRDLIQRVERSQTKVEHA